MSNRRGPWAEGAPGPAVPRELAAFSGKWAGQWDLGFQGSRDHTLVVEEIQATEAIAIYAWGGGTGVTPGRVRAKARFAEGVLKLPLPTRPGASATYRMRPDGALEAEFQSPEGRVLRARLIRESR